jgi:hypothetical protein
MPFGVVHDLTGSYFWAWIVSGVVTFINSVFCWKYMQRPVRPQPAAGSQYEKKEEKKGLLAGGDDDEE